MTRLSREFLALVSNAGSSEGPALAAFGERLYGLCKGSGSDPGLYWASASASGSASAVRDR